MNEEYKKRGPNRQDGMRKKEGKRERAKIIKATGGN